MTDACLIFVDETGWAREDRFLGVGALAVAQGVRALEGLNDKLADFGFSGRLRWADLARREAEVRIAHRMLASVSTSPDYSFACWILDTDRVDVSRHYGSRWTAYNWLAARAIMDVLDERTVAAALLDRFSAPRGHEVEDPIRSLVNNDLRRAALIGVQRVSGDEVLGLQLADLLLGAITYQIRLVNLGEQRSSRRARLAQRVMQDFYGQPSYLGPGTGRLEVNRLTITVRP